MKRIAITQRVDVIKDYQERRDALDQKWFDFFKECHLLPIIIPNQLFYTKKIIEKSQIDGIVLTGGNTLSEYDGNAPERDEVERELINYAIDQDMPLLGVCRGMQMIQNYFGVKLISVKGHVTPQMKISLLGQEIEINSYHDIGTRETADELEVQAKSSDGIIKAIQHCEKPIKGIMWHPERMTPFSKRDIQFFHNFFYNGRNCKQDNGLDTVG